MERILKKIINSPKSVILFFIAVSVFCIFYSSKFLTINTSTDTLINKNLNFKQNQEKLKQEFPVLANNILIRISGDNNTEVNNTSNIIIKELEKRQELSFLFSPSNDQVFKDNYFIFLNNAQKKQIVDKLYDYQPFLSEINNNPRLEGFNNLLTLYLKNEEKNHSLDQLEKIFESFLISIENKKKVNWTNLLNDSKNSSFIIIGLKQQFLNNSSFSDFYDFLNNLIKNSKNKTKIEFTGGLVIDYEEMKSVSKGASKAGIMSLIFVGFILWFAIKNIKVITFLLLSIILGLIITLGLTTFFIGSLNLISVAFAVLFIGLSVDYGIQVFLRFNEKIKNNQTSMIVEKTKDISLTLLIASIPSMIGFLSFVPTDYNGLSELGLISFFGLLVGLIVNLTFLPSLLILFPGGIHKNYNYSSNIYEKVFLKLKQIKKILLFFFISILIFVFFFSKKISFDSDALNLKDPKLNSVILAKDLIEDNPTSDYIISIMINKDNYNQKKINNLLSEESIRSFFSYSSFTKKFESEELDYLKFLISSQKNINFFSKKDELDRFLRLIEEVSLIQDDEQSLISKKLIEMIEEHFSNKGSLKELEELLFNDFDQLMIEIQRYGDVNEDFLKKIPTYYTNRYLSDKGIQRIEIFPAKDVTKKENLKEFVLDVQKYFPDATGMPVVQFEAGEIVIQSFLKAMILSFSFLIIFIFFIFREFFLVFLTFLPIFISSILTILFMILLKLDLNFANMIALPLLYSLGVTYSIYFLRRLVEFGKLTLVISSNTPKAIIFSALTTIASFSTLAISPHNGTSSMGILLFISLLSTLIASVFFLPLILNSFENRFSK